jgi:hypothetical protein
MTKSHTDADFDKAMQEQGVPEVGFGNIKQEQGEPVIVEAVATIRNKGGELFVDWLIEGGLSAMVGGETLLICGERLTDSTGIGEVYTTPPQQRKPLTDADYVNACISYRHDFGLMMQDQRDKLLFTAKEWARAFGMNEAAHGIKE